MKYKQFPEYPHLSKLAMRSLHFLKHTVGRLQLVLGTRLWVELARDCCEVDEDMVPSWLESDLKSTLNWVEVLVVSLFVQYIN